MKRLWIALMIGCVLSLPSCRSCDKDREADEAPAAKKKAAKKPKAKAKAERPEKPVIKREGRILKATGEVNAKVDGGKTMMPASVGRELFIGDSVVTGDAGEASAMFVELGEAALGPRAEIAIGEFGRCTTVLYHGVLSLKGPSRAPSERRLPCLLVTPTAAIWAPQARGLIAATPMGRMRVGCLEGSLSVALTEGVVVVEAGKRIDIGTDGRMIGKQASLDADADAGQNEFGDWLAREWSKEEAQKGTARVKALIDLALGEVTRYGQSVESVTGLMASNRELLAAIRESRKSGDASGNPEEALKVREQITENSKKLLQERQTAITTWYRAILRIRLATELMPQTDTAFQARIGDLTATLSDLNNRNLDILKRKPRRAIKPPAGARTSYAPMRRKLPKN